MKDSPEELIVAPKLEVKKPNIPPSLQKLLPRIPSSLDNRGNLVIIKDPPSSLPHSAEDSIIDAVRLHIINSIPVQLVLLRFQLKSIKKLLSLGAIDDAVHE